MNRYRAIAMRWYRLAVMIVAAGCVSQRDVTTSPNLAETCDVSIPPDLLGSSVVAIRGFSFEPETVHVVAGGTVTWVNCAPADEPAHTSTADQGVWGSDLLESGDVFSFTFAQAGSFPYHCEPHPFMQGVVVVR